jgi:predicted NAD/FAD-binding protein
MKIAVVGTGIAGMSAAYFLNKEHDVTLFEKNEYVGGHTNTIEVHDGQKTCHFDTGFMVFNEKTYPHFLKFLAEIHVSYVNTDMSFSVWHESSNLEYNGSSLWNGLFAQKKNLFNKDHLRMIYDIIKFKDASKELLKPENDDQRSIAQLIKDLSMSEYFLEKFLIPMSSAVWSTPRDKMLEFPAKTMVQFFHNHNLLGADKRLQWKTIPGGSRTYRDKIVSILKNKIRINEPVLSVERIVSSSDNQKASARLNTSTGTYEYDKVILASHGDESLKLLKNPTDFQKQILSCFKYEKNVATIHTDESVMPPMKINWSSWNYIERNSEVYTTYYMNRLQGVSDRKNYFVNMNGESYIDPSKIVKKFVYHHPLFDQSAIQAQKKLFDLNQTGPVYFAGSYFRFGFHEDALWSSVNLCRHLLNKEVL